MICVGDLFLSAVGPWQRAYGWGCDAQARDEWFCIVSIWGDADDVSRHALYWSNLWNNIQKDTAQATVQVYCLWYCKVYHVDSSIFKLSGRNSTTELSSSVAK